MKEYDKTPEGDGRCETCNRPLTRRQKRFCSKSCKMVIQWNSKEFRRKAIGNLRQYSKIRVKANIY